MEQAKQRIELMDAARGLSLCLMVIHHFLYDLVVFAGAPTQLFWNPVFNTLHYFFAGLLRRGLRALAVALGITAATYFMGMTVVFGVLHLLGTCMLLYGLTQRFFTALNGRVPWLVPVLCAAGVLATARLADGLPTETPHLWILGLVTPEFHSSDYFPLLPWLFVFLLGAWAGKYVRERRLPAWFYEAKAPLLAAVGRRSLLVYVVHQPVLYGLTMLGLLLFGRR